MVYAGICLAYLKDYEKAILQEPRHYYRSPLF